MDDQDQTDGKWRAGAQGRNEERMGGNKACVEIGKPENSRSGMTAVNEHGRQGRFSTRPML